MRSQEFWEQKDCLKYLSIYIKAPILEDKNQGLIAVGKQSAPLSPESSLFLSDFTVSADSPLGSTVQVKTQHVAHCFCAGSADSVSALPRVGDLAYSLLGSS